MAVLDGKFSGQSPKYRFNSGNPKPVCACCNILIPRPKEWTIHIEGKDGVGRAQTTYNYIGTACFIYEAKSGYAVVYCSRECRDKHHN